MQRIILYFIYIQQISFIIFKSTYRNQGNELLEGKAGRTFINSFKQISSEIFIG